MQINGTNLDLEVPTLHMTNIWLLKFEYNEIWHVYNLHQLAETAVMAQSILEWKATWSNNKRKQNSQLSWCLGRRQLKTQKEIQQY